MGIYAMVSGNTVTNMIVAEDKVATEAALNCVLVELTPEQPLGVGWQLIDGVWTAPPEPEQIPDEVIQP